jgi:drug/metabolite transporter (DMT)-like permease
MGMIEAFLNNRSLSKMNLAIVYILVAVLAGAVGQILLKKGMGSMGALTLSLDQLWTILWRIGTNPYVIIGLFIYVCGTVFWLAALSRVDLSYAYPFASLSYIVMLIASWQLFNEDITPIRLVGTIVVGLGVFLISQS